MYYWAIKIFNNLPHEIKDLANDILLFQNALKRFLLANSFYNKVNPSRYGPRGFQEVKVPRFRENGTGWWYAVKPYAPDAFTPRKYSWYSFLLEAELTPGP